MRGLVIPVRLDRRAAEALALEIRMLAAASGLRLGRVDVLAGKPVDVADSASKRGRPGARARQKRIDPDMLSGVPDEKMERGGPP